MEKYKTLVTKNGIPAGSIGLNRTVEGDKSIVLYFGFTDEPKYVEYEESEIDLMQQ